MALWIKSGTTYTLGWTKNIVRPTVLQSFTVQDGYIYYIDCYCSSSNYHTININRIDIGTGITEYNGPIAGTILQLEAEGITPVGKDVFYITTNNGRGFLVRFKKV